MANTAADVLRYLVQSDEDSCWIWVGSTGGFGYGQLNIGGRPIGTHRLAWEYFNGMPVPDGMMVLHKCDNPPCCNPYHLFIGTQTDNMSDARDKGRHKTQFKVGESYNAGEAHGMSKLTHAKAAEIRELASHGETTRSLTQLYSVSARTIQRVVSGRLWAPTQEGS